MSENMMTPSGRNARLAEEGVAIRGVIRGESGESRGPRRVIGLNAGLEKWDSPGLQRQLERDLGGLGPHPEAVLVRVPGRWQAGSRHGSHREEKGGEKREKEGERGTGSAGAQRKEKETRRRRDGRGAGEGGRGGGGELSQTV